MSKTVIVDAKQFVQGQKAISWHLKEYGHLPSECSWKGMLHPCPWIETCPGCGRKWGIKNLERSRLDAPVGKGVWFYCTKCKKWRFDKPE